METLDQKPTSSASAVRAAACPSCNNAYLPEDIFCRFCGRKRDLVSLDWTLSIDAGLVERCGILTDESYEMSTTRLQSVPAKLPRDSRAQHCRDWEGCSRFVHLREEGRLEALQYIALWLQCESWHGLVMRCNERCTDVLGIVVEYLSPCRNVGSWPWQFTRQVGSHHPEVGALMALQEAVPGTPSAACLK
eukprot:s1814_g7.t1